jgi:hypothetical protein
MQMQQLKAYKLWIIKSEALKQLAMQTLTNHYQQCSILAVLSCEVKIMELQSFNLRHTKTIDGKPWHWNAHMTQA